MTTTLTKPTNPPSRRRLIVSVLSVFILVLWWMSHTIQDIPLVWDEGMTLARIDLIQLGWAEWRSGRITFPEFTETYWRFSRAEPDGHGPFYALWSMLWSPIGNMLFERPAADRFGSALLFALTCAAVYATMRVYVSFWAALASVLFLISSPRILPEVSFALIDGPLLCLALLAWCAFVWGLYSRSWLPTIAFGAFIGLAMGTKLTGWFLPLPYILWVLCEFGQPRFASLLTRGIASAAIALGVVFLVNVGWWPDPWNAIAGYFQSNLTRKETRPIPILFWGTRYDFSLPWYNTIVWTAIATPIGIFLFGLGGIYVAVKRRLADPILRLLIFNVLLILVLRALPQAPGHDGTRQLIIGLAFFALLGGWTLEYLRGRLTQSDAGRWIGMGLLSMVLLLACIESFGAVRRYHPHQLSYYSPLINGLSGAEKLGFEPTYFWDSLTPEARAWLNTHTEPDRSVLFRNNTPSFKYLRDWGQLTVPVALIDAHAGPPKWLVLQHRPGLFTQADRRLMAEEKPAYQYSLFDVPLLSIYPFEAWDRVQKENPRP